MIYPGDGSQNQDRERVREVVLRFTYKNWWRRRFAELLYIQALQEEREACAILAETFEYGIEVAKAIRART